MIYREEDNERCRINSDVFRIVVIAVLVIYFVGLGWMTLNLHSHLVECSGSMYAKEERRLSHRYYAYFFYIDGTPNIEIEGYSWHGFRMVSASIQHRDMENVRSVRSNEPKTNSYFEQFWGNYFPNEIPEKHQQGDTFYFYVTTQDFENIRNTNKEVIDVKAIFVSSASDCVGSFGYWLSLVSYALKGWAFAIYLLILFSIGLIGERFAVKGTRLYICIYGFILILMLVC